MVANITTGKDIYGALAYNQRKVDRVLGESRYFRSHSDQFARLVLQL